MVRPLRSVIVLVVLALAAASGCTGGEPEPAGGQPAGGTAAPTSAAPSTTATTTTAATPATPTGAQGPGWSTSPKERRREPSTVPLLVGVRVGHHAGYDRVTFEFDGPAPGWRVAYVPRVDQDGSGAPVPLAGSAFLHVMLTPANAHTEQGARSYRDPTVITPGFPTLKQVKAAGDFEAVVSFGLGLRSKVGFRVLELRDPARIVVDVAA